MNGDHGQLANRVLEVSIQKSEKFQSQILHCPVIAKLTPQPLRDVDSRAVSFFGILTLYTLFSQNVADPTISDSTAAVIYLYQALDNFEWLIDQFPEISLSLERTDHGISFLFCCILIIRRPYGDCYVQKQKKESM